jgi:methylated-DNA-[protein]-cysteine S-methyltransferase
MKDEMLRNLRSHKQAFHLRDGTRLHEMSEASMFYDFLDSPIGPLVIVCDEDALTALLLPKNGKPGHIAPEWQRSSSHLREVRAQLAAYFAGKLLTFDVPLAPRGTEFQRSVWDELLRIPYGDTMSYIELARRIGNPAAMRAVGAANGANPIAIIVPCHRVIGADGTLTGYGGGLPAKRWLLDHERHYAPAPLLELRP